MNTTSKVKSAEVALAKFGYKRERTYGNEEQGYETTYLKRTGSYGHLIATLEEYFDSEVTINGLSVADWVATQ